MRSESCAILSENRQGLWSQASAELMPDIVCVNGGSHCDVKRESQRRCRLCMTKFMHEQTNKNQMRGENKSYDN